MLKDKDMCILVKKMNTAQYWAWHTSAQTIDIHVSFHFKYMYVQREIKKK